MSDDAKHPRHDARPTMQDVASPAGAATNSAVTNSAVTNGAVTNGAVTKTVSRVINGEPPVAPESAPWIHETAGKPGFRPNLTASSLRRGDRRGDRPSATIGLLLEDVSNPFSAALLRAVEDQARQRQVQILMGSLDEDGEREREMAISLIDRGVDGLVIVPAARDQSYLLAERQLGTSVVFLDREPRLLDADAVVSDNCGGASAAVDHLRSFGHQRIAYLGDSLAIATAAQRFEGYCQALERVGLLLDLSIVRHDLRSTASARAAALEIIGLPDPPTALFTSQNLVTIGAVDALYQCAAQDVIALVGFDDFPFADVLHPGITVMAQDAAGLGQLATQLLFARLDGDDTPARTHVIQTSLVMRGSGEITPDATHGSR